MNTVSIEKNGVLMVAHRGVSGLEAENTCAAFVAAGNRSYFGVETDVHVTADGKYILTHDDNARRVSGVDAVIEKTDYAALQAIPLYDKEEGVSRADLRMPDLADYIRICKRYGKKAVLELKNAMTREHIAGIAAVIRSLDYLEGTIFISFVADNLIMLREMEPDQAIQFLDIKCDATVLAMLEKYHFGLDILHTAVTREIVDAVHAIGGVVNCWTVDTPVDAQRVIACGVDQITSNILE